ncbi:MAG: Gfo/Idh/MocA family oxidoreductase [Sedimentisphaerales bacterium]|nr:Gfo/Idh/MocA family oxidoreductase [Sedimentisphaerales bacterium]
METIGVALIGSGYIAHYHARGLRELPGIKLRALCSLDGEGAKPFAEECGIDQVTGRIGGLLDRKDIHAVIISTPNKFHAPYAVEFMSSGKDVFVEKPMAVSAQQGAEMIECCRRTGRILMVGHMWRFDTEVNYVRDLIRSGKLGQIFKTKGYGIHVNWGPGGWFVDKALAGGGSLVDMGVHAIDTVRYLLGDPQPKEVYAKISTRFGDYQVDDTSVVMITWDSGTVSIVESGWWHPHADAPEAGTQIFGTLGYASLFPTGYKIKAGEDMIETIPEMPERKEHCDQVMYTRQMKHFIECIRTRSEPSASMIQGQTALQIMDAAYESARTGEVVRL